MGKRVVYLYVLNFRLSENGFLFFVVRHFLILVYWLYPKINFSMSRWSCLVNESTSGCVYFATNCRSRTSSQLRRRKIRKLWMPLWWGHGRRCGFEVVHWVQDSLSTQARNSWACLPGKTTYLSHTIHFFLQDFDYHWLYDLW